MAISRQDVITAFEQLKMVNGGQNPTRQDVRDYLGSGSMTTINKYMKEYIEELEMELALDERAPLPSVEEVMLGLSRLLKSMDARLRRTEAELAALREEWSAEDVDAVFGEEDFPDLAAPRAVGE